MEKIGVVSEELGNKIKIKVARDSSCGGNCAHCLGCAGQELYIEAKNTDNFRAGEQVKILMENPVFYKRMLGGYALPALLFVVGAACGYFISKSDIVSALSGLVLLAVSLVCQRKLFKSKDVAVRVERISG